MKFRDKEEKSKPRVGDIWLAKYSYNPGVRFCGEVVRLKILYTNNYVISITSEKKDYFIDGNVKTNNDSDFRSTLYSFKLADLIRRVHH
jgi:hypothetical protein